MFPDCVRATQAVRTSLVLTYVTYLMRSLFREFRHILCDIVCSPYDTAYVIQTIRYGSTDISKGNHTVCMSLILLYILTIALNPSQAIPVTFLRSRLKASTSDQKCMEVLFFKVQVYGSKPTGRGCSFYFTRGLKFCSLQGTLSTGKRDSHLPWAIFT